MRTDPLPSVLPAGLPFALCLMLAGCAARPHAPEPPPLPLPALPPTQEEQLTLALQEAQRRIEKNPEIGLYLWRRLAWIQHHRKKSTEARTSLDRAIENLNPGIFPQGQESNERAALAEQFLLMGETERARRAMEDFRYQGGPPRSERLLRRTTLTPLEIRRLNSPEIFLLPRLIVALVDMGPRAALLKELQPRLNFALMRGSEGGRAESYHGAIVLQFYLGDPMPALRATERQSPQERVRTLACLHFGGTTYPGTILYQGDYFPSLRAARSEPLRRQLRSRLLAALSALLPDSLSSLDMNAILLLAYQDGDSMIVQEAAQRVADPLYRSQLRAALAANQPLLLPPLSSDRSGVERLVLLSRTLGRLLAMRPGLCQEQLLEQFIGELKGSADERFFDAPLAATLRKLGRSDMLARLLQLQPDAAFHCHETLLNASAALEHGQKPLCRQQLQTALEQLTAIQKPSHQAQGALFAQEIARRLGDKDLLRALVKTLNEILPRVSISLLRDNIQLHQAGLYALLGDTDAYRALIASLNREEREDIPDRVLSGAFMERMVLEQARVGRRADAWESIRKISAPVLQASALLTFAEASLQTPPLPSIPLMATLQNSGGRGGSLSLPR